MLVFGIDPLAESPVHASITLTNSPGDGFWTVCMHDPAAHTDVVKNRATIKVISIFILNWDILIG